ncbi:DUF4406 domain-containing protein [Neolewinella antarctica]|uniref:DUF4406 domain-containing protein n=1 Tax=Neolewinella antarctica TaxID=442734 RepID=A0ABX0XDZ0_9BACT|nr:DUF4406 domain-containing protein [Neolewinella antarctica]NJC27432.1 hypothetical protein [Neolewinella antarctica]
MMIMISGPYRSGTNDDEALIKTNLDNLERNAYEVFLKGHTPMVGEWLALPLMTIAGSKEVGDEVYNSISYPIAHRILRNCDGVLRIAGASNGADKDVEVAKSLGLQIFTHLNQIPNND